MLLTILQFYMTILLLFMILHILDLHLWSNCHLHNLTNYPSVVKWLLWKSGLLIFDRLRDVDLEKRHWKGVFIEKKNWVWGIKTRAAAQAPLRNPTSWEATMLTVESGTKGAWKVSNVRWCRAKLSYVPPDKREKWHTAMVGEHIWNAACRQEGDQLGWVNSNILVASWCRNYYASYIRWMIGALVWRSCCPPIRTFESSEQRSTKAIPWGVFSWEDDSDGMSYKIRRQFRGFVMKMSNVHVEQLELAAVRISRHRSRGDILCLLWIRCWTHGSFQCSGRMGGRRLEF